VADGEYCGTESPEGDAATLIASEALFEDDRVWRAVPRNSLVTVAPDGETTTEPLDLDLSAG
jgi:predicted glutamine amidotransferase